MPKSCHSATLHILILDDAGGPSVYKPTVYSDFIQESDNVELFILTSENGVSAIDKEKCFTKEIENIIHNGMMEVVAMELHQQYRIDLIYTKQEDLILRAAHLRALMGCKIGLQPQDALVFRDKELMKRAAQKSGVAVPFFERIRTPADVLQFTQNHGYPIVLKPVLGSASAGVKIMHNEKELHHHFKNDFFNSINENGGQHDHPGDVLIESFAKGKMFHVNGYARQGKLCYIWPFAYVNSNLGFTQGNAYGNISIAKEDAQWQPLVDFAQSMVDAMPRTRDLFFHLELFVHENEYVLCEIAARRPGGSIALLMDAVMGGEGLFPEVEFRLSVGLSPRQPLPAQITVDTVDVHQTQHSSILKDTIKQSSVFGDMMIPLQQGKLISLPEHLPFPVQYRPIAKPGTVYHGFDMTKMNTCARLIAEADSREACHALLLQATDWFQQNVVYEKRSSLDIFTNTFTAQ